MRDSFAIVDINMEALVEQASKIMLHKMNDRLKNFRLEEKHQIYNTL